ncbi:UDP-N-acetylmuramate dehydrogenase [Candidatus Babeliales bacterium]|nr:UDP-N-acetylmuramate dehydrogenase [Candidatus Babeliales bacterium]
MDTSRTLHHDPSVVSLSIQTNIPLADKNWFQTGGNARYYCRPKNSTDFAQALDFAQRNKLDIFILGQGANILISDDGFEGLVIHPEITDISIARIDATTAHVTAGAGVTIHDLIVHCLNNQLLGLEEFSGIPGTVGGSVYINLHYYDFLLEQFLVHAHIIDRTTGEISTVEPSWFNFGYDQSKLQDKNYYLVSATFKVRCATELETAFAQGRREEIIRHRHKRFPTQRTCGSFFRNFLPHEVENTEKRLIFVAYYLDKIGVKGELTIGDAVVSHQHANMIVNKGHATSTDIIQLAQKMQQLVMQQFGIKPHAECQLVGFKNDPLA